MHIEFSPKDRRSVLVQVISRKDAKARRELNHIGFRKHRMHIEFSTEDRRTVLVQVISHKEAKAQRELNHIGFRKHRMHIECLINLSFTWPVTPLPLWLSIVRAKMTLYEDVL